MVDNERKMDEIQPPENPFIIMKKDFLEKTATILPKDNNGVEADDRIKIGKGRMGLGTEPGTGLGPGIGTGEENHNENDNDVDQQDKGNESSFKWRRQLFKESRSNFKEDGDEDSGERGNLMENLDLSDDSSISGGDYHDDDRDNKSLMLTFSAANKDLDDTDLDADSISNLEVSGRHSISEKSNFWND